MHGSSEQCTEEFPRPNWDAWVPEVQYVNHNTEEAETFAKELFSESDTELSHQLQLTNPY